MKSNHKALLLGGAAIAIGALVIVIGRGFVGHQQAAPLDSIDSHASGAPAPVPAAVTGEATPPWLQDPGAGGTTAIARITGTEAPAVNPADIEKSLVELRQKSAHNTRAADEMLMQLDTLEKSGQVPPDVRLDALRNNLVIAKRAQLLALELAESTRQTDGAKRDQRNAEIITELQQLQAKLRYDVGGPAAPAAGRAQ